MLHNRQFVLDSCNLNHTNNDLSIAGKPNKISMEILAVEKSGVDTLSSITVSNLSSPSSAITYTYSQIKQYVTNNSGIGVGFEFDLIINTDGTVSVIIKQRGYGYESTNVVRISIPNGYNGIAATITSNPVVIDITVGDVVPSILDIQSTVLGNFRLLTGTKMTYDISPCSFRPDNIRMDVFYAGEDGSLHHDVHDKTEELVSGSPSQSKPGFRIFINFNISFEPFHK